MVYWTTGLRESGPCHSDLSSQKYSRVLTCASGLLFPAGARPQMASQTPAGRAGLNDQPHARSFAARRDT